METIRIPEVSGLLDFLAARAAAPSTVAAVPQMTIPFEDVWGEFYRQMKSRMKTPRGLAAGGGSMQTMFEMPMVTAGAAKAMFGEWPPKAQEADPCWELTTMELCETHLAFQNNAWAKEWGWGNGRLVSTAGAQFYPYSLLLAAPPFTVRLRRTVEGLTILQVNYPLVLFTETNSVILPPDMNDVPFYQDPANRPGLHRDLFAAHSKQLLGKLLAAGFTCTGSLTSCAPTNIQQQVASATAAAVAAEEAAAAARDAAELEELGMAEVSAIVAERPAPKRRKHSNAKEYLVEWTGYRVEWEANYRQGRGAVGDPFTSWERESSLRKLDAFKVWKAAHLGVVA